MRTINAHSDVFKDGCHLKRVKDTKAGVASTADSVSKFMRKCWSRRSSRENNAGLACGHEQVKRLESADTAKSSARNRKSQRVRVRSIACTQCAQIGETRNVPQQDRVNGTQSTGDRPRFCQASSVECSDSTWENDSDAGVDRPPQLFESSQSTRYSTPRRSAEIHVFGTIFSRWRLAMF